MRICLAFCLFSLTAHADIPAVMPPTPAQFGWKGTVEGGYIHSESTANSGSQTVHGQVSITRTGPYWINIFNGEGLSVRNDLPGAANPERYLLAYRARHFFDQRDYFAFRNQWEKDLVSNHEYQTFSSLNLGRDIVKDAQEELKIELGAGERYTAGLHAADLSEAIGLASWDYSYIFNPDRQFNQKGGVEYGSADKVFRISTQFRQNMTKVIALTLNNDFKKVRGDTPTRESVMSIGLCYQL